MITPQELCLDYIFFSCPQTARDNVRNHISVSQSDVSAAASICTAGPSLASGNHRKNHNRINRDDKARRRRHRP